MRPPHLEKIPAHTLTVDEYNKHHLSLKKYKIKSMGDIKCTGSDKTLDLTTFCAADRSRYKLALEATVPEFWLVLIRASTKSNCSVTLTSKHQLPYDAATTKIYPLPELQYAAEVTITTDGSYKEDKMGSAAVFEVLGSEPIIKTFKPESHDPSAIKAELEGLYGALLFAHPSNRITFRYDCEDIKN
jgi:hypothetical protein